MPRTKFYSGRKKPLRRGVTRSQNIKRRITKKAGGIVKTLKTSRHKRLLLLTYLTSFTLSAILIGIFIMALMLAIFSRDLPNPNTLLERSEELSTKILDRNGESLYEVYGEKHRSLIKLDEVNADIMNATLAVEDSNFYLHQGISVRGILRAVRNMAFGGSVQSGSTITQQVVKNALLTQEQTITRKLKEIVLSLQLENRYEKDEILQMYLNETPYGGQNYGILTAARAYFNKHPMELSIAESAFLAGLPQSPTRYSPFSSDPSAGLERKNYVLYLMNVRGWLDSEGERNFLSDEEYETARDEELIFEATGAASLQSPHFVFFVREQLAEMFGEDVVEQSGFHVTTTLDLELQKKLQEIVKEEIKSAAGVNVGNGSLVAIEPSTGQILAMVGSKDYFADSEPAGCTSGITGPGSCTFEAKLNVTLAKRQPGSSIKPITYATMLSQGYPASFPILDVPTVFLGADNGKDYEPENYDGEFRGAMSIRKSLGNSINIPAVKAIQLVGIDSMIKQAQKLGISTFDEPDRYGLSITLGGGETRLLEMTGAFAAFGAEGVYREPIGILEVRDPKGKVLFSWRDNGGTQAVSEEVAFLISDILSDDGARSEIFGFGSLLNIPGHQVAVKTGTTDDKRDNYALGYTPSIAIGVWVGNNNNAAMYQVASGISGATPIWRRAMLAFLEDFEGEPERFNPPNDVSKYEVDALTGMLPFKDYKTRHEWFIKGTEPQSVSDWYRTLQICKVDGKLASKDCKNADGDETKTYIDMTAAIREWQPYVDAWLAENYEDSVYFPPNMESGLEFEDDGDVKKDTKPKVAIVSYGNGDDVPLKFRISVEVSSPRDIKKVKIYMDGDEVTSDKSEPYGYNFELDASQAGEHEFKASAEDEKGRKGDVRIKLTVVAPKE